MRVLIDTSVLGRLANLDDQAHAVAQAAIQKLHARSDSLFLTAQNLIELRNFATRPTTVNGLGFSAIAAGKVSDTFEGSFQFLKETADVYVAWKNIVTGLAVVGKQVHDARLVAVCHANQVSAILTFNTAHFARFASFGPGLTVLNPTTL